MINDFITLLRPFGGKIIDFAFTSLDITNRVIMGICMMFLQSF